MKTVLIVVLALLISPVWAWEEPDNFRGIKWGTSPEDAMAVIRQQWKERGVAPQSRPYTYT